MKELQGIEGIPNDHQSIAVYFHSNGLNMRYLGRVHAGLKETNNCKHMMNQIERDILLRSFKHIFNEILRESQMQYCSDIVSHLLNCILGGEELVKALNN